MDSGPLTLNLERDPTFSARQLLATLDTSFDVSGDRDGTTDDEADLGDPSQDDAEAGSIIGVSISHAQTHMKSPHTPAVEKAQALERSYNYFNNNPTVDNEAGTAPAHTVDQILHTFPDRIQHPQPSPWKSQPEEAKRSSLTRNILSSGQNVNRQRSSSGSSAILSGLRKIFTPSSADLPATSNSGEADAEIRSDTDDKHLRPAFQTRRDRSQSLAYPQSPVSPVDGLAERSPISPAPSSRPKSLRRHTSDQSLYLRRVPTGASEFDNTSIYAHIADQTNSRFKAITDSLADSSIKLPKLPNFGFSSPRQSVSRVNSDLTKTNTALNTGTNSPVASRDGDLFQPGGALRSVPSGDKKHPMLNEALSRLTGDLVVMGGYRGSVLRSTDPPYHQLWVPVKVGLNLRKVDLEVGLTHEDEEKMEETIMPSGILSHIGPIDIARRLLKKIRKCPNVKTNQLRLFDWGYDWRLSPHLLSRRLIELLECLECNAPGTPPEKRGAWVVAHSLGGLITRHAVNLRPELFAGVVYAGSPQNCCNILGPLRNGDDVLLSSRVLTAQVNFTLRTSYALLPEDGRCFINKYSGERYDVDFFDLKTWDEYRLSPCINPPLPPLPAPQPRKSLVGSITDSISSFTPSLPTKRSSWFSNSTTGSSDQIPTNSSSSSPPPTQRDNIKDQAHKAKDSVENSARATADGLVQDGSLEPTMRPGNNNHTTTSSSSSNRPSIATTVTIPKDKASEYLARTLREVKQFKAELAHLPTHQSANAYPPHAIIFGKTVPTVYGARVASRNAIKHADAYDDLAFAAGDGVVLASAAQLPPGYRCVKGGRVESDRGHVGLLGDLEGIGRCLCAVIEGRMRGIGWGADV